MIILSKNKRGVLIKCDKCPNKEKFRLDSLRSEYLWNFHKLRHGDKRGQLACTKCVSIQKDPYNLWVKGFR